MERRAIYHIKTAISTWIHTFLACPTIFSNTTLSKRLRMAAPALTRLATGDHRHSPTGRCQQARHHLESVLLVRSSSKLVVRRFTVQSAKARTQHKFAWALVKMHLLLYKRIAASQDFATRIHLSRKPLTIALAALLMPPISTQPTYLR